MGRHGLDDQVQVYLEQHHGGTAARVLHRVERAGQLDHAKPEPAESVPGQFEHERRGVHGPGETDQVGFHARRRGQGPGAGHRHVDMAVGHPAHGAVRVHRVHRVVERPEPPAEARAPVARLRRARPGPGPVGVRALFLRAAHGNRRSRRIAAVVVHGRMDDNVHGRVHVHFGRHVGELLAFSLGLYAYKLCETITFSRTFASRFTRSSLVLKRKRRIRTYFADTRNVRFPDRFTHRRSENRRKRHTGFCRHTTNTISQRRVFFPPSDNTEFGR